MIKKFFLFSIMLLSATAKINFAVAEQLPGVVINHIPAHLNRFIGSPSICIMPNGDYIASHDEFGPTSTEFKSGITRIYTSHDQGATWHRIAQIDGQFWSSLFIVDETLYILGTNKHHGNIVLRESKDGGHTWSIPYDSHHGLLLEGEYHTAPTPVVIYRGRVWRAIEYATAKTTKWGERYSAMMISAPIGSNLMNAANWTHTNHLGYDASYLNGNFRAWLEGNAVPAPDGDMLDILRVHVPKGSREFCALVRINRNGKKAMFDPKDFYMMPGSAKKFSIRYDAKSHRYWCLANVVPDSLSTEEPDKIRNVIQLISSKDLKEWEKHMVVLSHDDFQRHGFQYLDWQIDGDDIIFVSRTAYDDEDGGAIRAHDANYLTFHRIPNFREQ